MFFHSVLHRESFCPKRTSCSHWVKVTWVSSTGGSWWRWDGEKDSDWEHSLMSAKGQYCMITLC